MIRYQLRCISPLPGIIRGLRFTSTIVNISKFNDLSVSNEPILDYRIGSCERSSIANDIAWTSNNVEDVPIVIGGKEIRSGVPQFQVMPHNHGKKIAKFYYASEEAIRAAIDVCVISQASWDRVPLHKRISIWEYAANKIAGEYRQHVNSATLLGQSKTLIQAEIDTVQVVDYLRFHSNFLKKASNYQPVCENTDMGRNSIRFRGIDGFVAAISPYNSTAAAMNLAYTPALMGNCVIWRPSDSAILSNWKIFNIMREAGLPDGIVNFVPSDEVIFGRAITASPHLAGINFAGHMPIFDWLWSTVSDNISMYRNYPRLVGECGGNNYHFVHKSADLETVVASTIRSAFEYSGQKRTSCSRIYVPRSISEILVQGLISETTKLKVGDPADFSVYMGAIADSVAYTRVVSYVEEARVDPDTEIIYGGTYDNQQGYFVHPTIVETIDPKHRLMTEDIFGPILIIYIYEDTDLDDTLSMVGSSKFALAGSIFAKDQAFISDAFLELKMTAGNLFINDKCSDFIVGQQPFGGGRRSGTNDQAGGPNYIMRWTSPQTITETFTPLRDIIYPCKEQ